ncbi:CPBP family intramembrane metalloprotease [Parabacteroides sp. PF5-9]|uniref:CPBP family intramembrane glutamic endopeptidase n=1 Tax=Parabacteroides sp. PF5-9 TaxID=1742404 RepID=UPI0024736C39|nr:CPBP family intramembrane metalloprotease [Parabacteroides sp. PF5-9]MDH6358799.1 membrane protease YdiL (CAAX protease family) [Parabacteroides sp. PF5-9]
MHMKLKGIFADKSAWSQLFVLISLVLIGMIFSSLIGFLIFYPFYGWTADLYKYPHMLRWVQLISAVGIFLLPALGMSWLCSKEPAKYLSLGRCPNLRVILLVFVSMLLLSPMIGLTEMLNRQMEFPAFMEPVEHWMRAKEEAAGDLTKLLLADTDIVSLLFNVLVIGVAAGVTEEFFFRGALQRVIEKWGLNHHWVIWIAAFVFSAIHLQFFGLIPRMMIGAYLGYLLFWSKNIWVPIFAHFANNTFAILVMSDDTLKNNPYLNGEAEEVELLPFTLIAVVSFLFFWLLTGRLKKVLNCSN